MNNSNSNSGGGEGGEQQQLSAAAGNNGGGGGGGVSLPPPSNASPSSSMAVVVVVRATHEYCPVNNDELHIRVGDLITVTNMEEGGWWEGTSSSTGTVGWFPSNYVVLVEEGTQQQQLNHHQQQQQNVVVTTRDNVSGGGGNITKHEEYRNEIVAEMVESEAAFITEMESFLERGVKRMIGMVGGNSLGGSPQDPQVLQTLSTCFTMLIAAHKKHVLGELAPLSSGNQTTSSPQTQQITTTTTSSGSPSSQQPPRVVGSVRVGRVFLTAAPHLESAHTRYCALHPRVVQFVERNQEVLASSFAGEARDNSGVLKIITSLSAPFRRVERYARVLHEVERHVEEYHWDRGDLQRGVLYYRDLAKTLTDLRKQKEMELEVLTPGAIKDYEGTDITSLGDIILMKLVFVGRDRQPRYFVLFPNTIVILAYDNTDNTLTYKGRVLVSGVTVNPITDGQVLLVQTHQNHNNNQLLDEDNNGNNNNNNGLITNAFEISGPTLHPILVQCPTPKDKVTWLHHLNELLRVTRCFSSNSSGMMMMNNNGSGVVGNVNASTTQPHHQQQQVHHRQHRHDTSRRRRRRQGDDAMKSKKREVVVVEASYPFVRLVEHFRRLYELGVLVTLSNQFLNNNNNDTSCCGNNNHGQESFEGEGEEECFVVRKRVLRFPPAAVVETVPAAAAVPVAAGENGSAGYWRGRRRQRGEFISGNQDDDDYDSDNLLLLLPPTGNDVAAVRKFKCLSNIHDHNDEDHDNGGGGGGESELFTCRRSFEVDSRHHSNTPTTRGCTSLPKELSYCYHHHHHQHRSQSSSSSSSSYHTAYHDDDNNVERVVGYRKSKRVLVRQDAFDYSSDRDSVDSGLGDNNFSGSGGSTAAAAAEGNSGGGGGENEHVGGDVVARAGGGGEDYDDDDELLEEEEQQPSVFYNEVFVNVGGGSGAGEDATSREQQQQQQRSSPVTTTTYTNSLYAHWCLKIESDVWNA